MDEETKYSAVEREKEPTGEGTDGSGKYVPPSRRTAGTEQKPHHYRQTSNPQSQNIQNQPPQQSSKNNRNVHPSNDKKPPVSAADRAGYNKPTTPPRTKEPNEGRPRKGKPTKISLVLNLEELRESLHTNCTHFHQINFMSCNKISLIRVYV